MLIFAAEIKKNAKYAHTFLIFRYNRGENNSLGNLLRGTPYI